MQTPECAARQTSSTRRASGDIKATGVSVRRSPSRTVGSGNFLSKSSSDPTIGLVRATHEEEALAIACGIRLGGVRTVLIVQNAGLLSSGAGMVCLAQRYQFPILILVSYRGTPSDPVFYHVPKGRATEPVLQWLGGPFCVR